MQFELPEATVLLNTWQRWHWRRRREYVERMAILIRASVGTIPRQPITRCTVHIERHSAGLPDWDGLYGGLKALLDCLVMRSTRNPHGLGIIRDDNPQVILDLKAVPVICKPGQGRTVVTITEVRE